MAVENLFEKYKTILAFNKRKVLFLQEKGGKPFMVTSKGITELPYTAIVDKKRKLIRVYKVVDGVNKWGVINWLGREIVPPVYDYISPIISSGYFKVFSGDFKWEYHSQSHDLFYDVIEDSGLKRPDEYKCTLGYGTWGVISLYNNQISSRIPMVYEWVEFISDEYILCNVGGKRIIKWSNGRTRKNEWAIIDGKWEIRHSSKIIIPSGSLEEVMDKFAQFSTGQAYSLQWQRIGKYRSEW